MDNSIKTNNGDVVHDMWVDYDYNEDNGEYTYVEDETDLDKFIDDLNDWD